MQINYPCVGLGLARSYKIEQNWKNIGAGRAGAVSSSSLQVVVSEVYLVSGTAPRTVVAFVGCEMTDFSREQVTTKRESKGKNQLNWLMAHDPGLFMNPFL